MKIQNKIDCHMHITPPELIKNYKKLYKKEPYWKLLSESKCNKFATGDQIAEQLKNSGFQKGICFGFSFKDLGLCSYVNDYMIEMIKKYPDIIIGQMSISPKAKGAIKEARRAYEKGLKGVSELFFAGQDIDPFSKKDLKPLMDFCFERNLIINIHSNEPVGHYYAGKTTTTPKEITNVAMNFPNNIFVAAHFGGGLPFYELMKEMKIILKNVYYDTAAGIYLYSPLIFSVLKKINIIDKIVFGSDFPLIKINSFEKYLKESNLNKKDLMKILGNNIKKIYNI